MARKTDVLDLLVTRLKLINGGTDGTYTYKSNVNDNVDKKFRYLDDINDFPSITFMVGNETREHIGGNIRYATLGINIRGYVEGDIGIADDLLEDIADVVDNFTDAACGSDMVDARVISASTDEGLFDPYGICDVIAQFTYQVSESI